MSRGLGMTATIVAVSGTLLAGCSGTDHTKDPLPPESSQSSSSSAPTRSAPTSTAGKASRVTSSPARSTTPTSTRPRSSSEPSPSQSRSKSPGLSAAEKNAITKAYMHGVRVYEMAARNPGKDWHLALEKIYVRTGAANQLKNLALIHQAGEVAYGNTRIRVISVSPNGAAKATVRACTDSSHTGLKDAKTGEVRSRGRTGVPVSTLMVRVNGIWKSGGGVVGTAGTC